MNDATVTFLTNLILSLVFTALGVVLALWYENLGAPKLEVIPSNTTDSDQPNGVRRRFLHVKVRNKPRKVPLVTQQTAYSCHGTITFFNKENRQVGREIPIKWDGTPEPIKLEIADKHLIYVPDPALFRATRYIDVPPGEEESLALAIRIFEDDCAYGWTTDSYQNGWKLEDCCLPSGEYRANVKVITGDTIFYENFYFSNVENFEQFDLVPLPRKRNNLGVILQTLGKKSS